MWNAIIAVVIFFAAHFALLVGVTTPDKFYFDEVHYVPAARQMLEAAPSAPLLNPMHPPLAKQLIALSNKREQKSIRARCSRIDGVAPVKCGRTEYLSPSR